VLAAVLGQGGWRGHADGERRALLPTWDGSPGGGDPVAQPRLCCLPAHTADVLWLFVSAAGTGTKKALCACHVVRGALKVAGGFGSRTSEPQVWVALVHSE